MSALTQLAGDAVAAHVFELKDTAGKVLKTYTLRLIDDNVHAEWEKEQLRRDRDFEFGNKPYLTSSEFKERLDAIGDKYHKGVYSLMYWFAENAVHFEAAKPLAAAKVAQAPLTPELLAIANAVSKELGDGMTLLSSLIFQCPVAEMRKLMTTHGPEVASLIGIVIAESLPTATESAPSQEAPVPNP